MTTDAQWATLTLEEQVAILTGAAESMTAEVTEDVPPANPERGLKGRFAAVQNWGREKLAKLRGSESNSGRKAVAGIVAGALAVTAAAGLLRYDAEHQGDRSAVTRLADTPGASGENNSGLSLVEPPQLIPTTPDTGLDTSPSLVEPAQSSGDTATAIPADIGPLSKGENPWTESRDYLQALGLAKPTNAQIAAIDNWMMKQKGIDVSKGEDRRLPVGTRLPLPTKAQVEQILSINL